MPKSLKISNQSCSECKDKPENSGGACGECNEEDCHYGCRVNGNEKLESLLKYDCKYETVYHAFYAGVSAERRRADTISEAYDKVHDTDPMLQLLRTPKNSYEWSLIPVSLRKKVPCPHPSQGVTFNEAMRNMAIVKRYVCIMCHSVMPPENRCKEKLECPKCFYPGVTTCIGACEPEEFL